VVGLFVVVALVVVVTPSTIGKSFPEVTVVVVAPVVVVPPSTIGKSEVHFTFKKQKKQSHQVELQQMCWKQSPSQLLRLEQRHL
jgi:hypothetical protein